ncbi:two-component system response regulator [Salmonella enterica subsp. enterica serovar Typhimurium]|nr:two-component system response regulator [Salmonella enterica subsp. enterica serovar Typhimurium]
MIKVLIVDDEPLARENLRILLQGQDDIEIVGELRERGRSDWRGT